MRIAALLQEKLPERELLLYMTASFVNAFGSAFMWPLVTLYVFTELGRSYGEAGLVLFLQSIAFIIGQLLGGSLFYRVGPQRLIIFSLLLAGVVQLGIIFASWPVYILLMMCNGFLLAITMPVINAFIGLRWKERRRQLFNQIYVCNNVGMAIGTSLGGLLAVVSFNLTFLCNGITTILFALYFMKVFKRLPEEAVAELKLGKEQSEQQQASVWKMVGATPVYLFLGLGVLCIALSTSNWNSGVAPFLEQNGYSIAMYSFLWTINGIIILLGQPLTNWLKKVWVQQLLPQLILSSICYALGFGLILFSTKAYHYFVLGMIICTFGEMLMAPAVPAYITERLGKQAPFYLGLVGAFGNTGRLIAPLCFGFMFDWWGANPIFSLAVCLALLSAVSYWRQQQIDSRPKNHGNAANLRVLKEIKEV